MQQLDRVPVAYRPPFGMGELYVRELLVGPTLLEMVRSVPNLPRDFMRNGYVCINGEVIPREMWAYVRPKPTRREVYVSVTLHQTLHSGGSGGGRKSVIGIVAAIALLVVAAFIAGPAGLTAALPELGLGTSISIFGTSITAAQILAGAVAIGGSLAIAALTAPPTTASNSDTGSSNTDNAEAASAQANIIDKSGSIPRVIGTRKIFPPLACEPVVELVGQDEYVEALFALNGPHKMSDIRIDGNTIAGASDVTYETREGFSTDTAITSITRQGRTTTPQVTLSVQACDDVGFKLKDQTTPTNNIPIYHRVASRSDPNELWIHLLLPGGIYVSGVGLTVVPLRIRIRRRGNSTWINLPEVHIALNSAQQYRAAIIFKFNTTWASPPDPPAQAGFWYAHGAPPIQTLGPTSAETWVADNFFRTGGGSDVLYQGQLGVTGLKNIKLYDNRVEVYFDPAQFALGTFGPTAYEVEIKRGHSFPASSFNRANYFYNVGPNIFDFFYYYNAGGVSPSIIAGRQNVSDAIAIARVVSIWNSPPLTTPGNFALIAMKARNRAIRSVSCNASGYVKDWNGSAWTTPYVVTSNPAPHYVDVLSGALNLDPLPSNLRGDTDLVAWRTLCNGSDWTCDAIINDMRVQDVLTLLASCGYARPYQSDTYKVIVDNDRSLDAPVQVFSRRNCANMRFERAFARVPAGFQVTYRDDLQDDDQAQMTVPQRNPANSDMSNFEAITYDGLITADKVRDRALFDLDQANLRSTFFYLDVDIESIVCQRGSLVAVEHDILQTRAGEGYIVSKQVTGGNIVGVTLDAQIPILSGTTGIVIRRTDGTLSTHAISNPTGNDSVLTFSTPIPNVSTIQGFADNDRRYGCLAVAGDLTTIYRRLLVHTIAPQANLTANMALVDEAPALVRYPSAKTLMLLHLDGFNGSTSFPDATGRHSVLTVGSTTITTATSKFGGASASFGSSVGYGLYTADSTDWDLQARDFTIDFQLFTNAPFQQQVIWAHGTPDGAFVNVMYINTSGQIVFTLVDNSALTFSFNTTATNELGSSTWTHVALERYNGVFYIYRSGLLRASSSGYLLPVADRSAPLALGTYVDGSNSWNGAIDEVRVSRVARYKGVGFTPPVAAYAVD